MSLLIEYPWIALLLSVGFALMGIWRRAASAWVASVLLAIYGVYEYLMHNRVLCSGECNIRVDLLVIYPVLLVAMIVGVLQSASSKTRPG